jgi:hypothetical protein
MQRENLDINEITEARRKSLAQTLHAVDASQVKAIGDELFPYYDDPWREKFFGFLAEHGGATFHHGTTSDGVQFLYCHDKNRGIWFVPQVGMGPLQAKGLGIMKELVEKGR